jgi:hypothetical protein
MSSTLWCWTSEGLITIRTSLRVQVGIREAYRRADAILALNLHHG